MIYTTFRGKKYAHKQTARNVLENSRYSFLVLLVPVAVSFVVDAAAAAVSLSRQEHGESVCVSKVISFVY